FGVPDRLRHVSEVDLRGLKHHVVDDRSCGEQHRVSGRRGVDDAQRDSRLTPICPREPAKPRQQTLTARYHVTANGLGHRCPDSGSLRSTVTPWDEKTICHALFCSISRMVRLYPLMSP